MAGLLDMFGQSESPFAQWFEPRRNTIVNGFAGMVGSGNDPRQALSGWTKGMLHGRDVDTENALIAKEEQEKKAALDAETAKQNQTIAWLKANAPDYADAVANGAMSAADAWTATLKGRQPGAAVDPTTTTGGRAQLAQTWGLSQAEAREYVLTGKLPGGNQTARAGVGQPIFGRNRTTMAIEPFQSMSDGTMVNIANPNANPQDYDFDPGIASGARSGGTFDAKTVSNAKAALRGMEQSVTITRQTLSNLRNNEQGMNEQFGNIMGIPQQMLPVLPQTARANFLVDLEQATGQAFMAAREALKGAGQVTDYEGRRAEAAYSKMEAASRSGDKKKFLEALDEFEQAVEAGYAKLQEVAGVDSVTPPAFNGNQTSTGVQWSVTP